MHRMTCNRISILVNHNKSRITERKSRGRLSLIKYASVVYRSLCKRPEHIRLIIESRMPFAISDGTSLSREACRKATSLSHWLFLENASLSKYVNISSGTTPATSKAHFLSESV